MSELVEMEEHLNREVLLPDLEEVELVDIQALAESAVPMALDPPQLPEQEAAVVEVDFLELNLILLILETSLLVAVAVAVVLGFLVRGRMGALAQVHMLIPALVEAEGHLAPQEAAAVDHRLALVQRQIKVEMVEHTAEAGGTVACFTMRQSTQPMILITVMALSAPSVLSGVMVGAIRPTPPTFN